MTEPGGAGKVCANAMPDNAAPATAIQQQRQYAMLQRGIRVPLALRNWNRARPDDGMVRRGFLEVVEFEGGGSHETTCGRH